MYLCNVCTPRHGERELDVESPVVLGQRDVVVEIDEVDERRKMERFRETVETVSKTDPDQLVAAAVSKGESKLAALVGSVADEEATVGAVLHDLVHFLAARVAPVPLTVVESVVLGQRRRRRTGFGREVGDEHPRRGVG
jgi:hypothetical protein